MNRVCHWTRHLVRELDGRDIDNPHGRAPEAKMSTARQCRTLAPHPIRPPIINVLDAKTESAETLLQILTCFGIGLYSIYLLLIPAGRSRFSGRNLHTESVRLI